MWLVVSMLSCLVPSYQLRHVPATLGTDTVHLADTEFEFIRINGDMEKEVSIKLDDERSVVTPYTISMKEN